MANLADLEARIVELEARVEELEIPAGFVPLTLPDEEKK